MMCQTPRSKPAARTRTSTSPSPMPGRSMSLSSRTSGEPYATRITAFIVSWRTGLGFVSTIAFPLSRRLGAESRELPLSGSRTNSSGHPLAAVPPYRVAYGLLEGRGALTERPLEPGVVHDEGFLELVEHLYRLADSRIEHSYGPEQDLRCRLDARRLADLLEDHPYELARRDRLGAGQVPRLPEGLLALAQYDQPPADVGHVGVGVGLVGVPGHLGGLAFHGATEDLLPGGRHQHAGAEEVRSPPDGDPHPAARVGIHQLLRHPRADRALAGVGSVGQVLGKLTTAGRPIHVEVLHRYELRPGGRGTLDHPGLQRREELGPPGVGRVEGEVDYRCPFAGLSGEGPVGGVASRDLHALGHACPAAAVDHPDAFTLLQEFVHYRQTHGPGAEDDVKLAVVAHKYFSSPRCLRRRPARGASG